jgi:hypothetical protein
MSSLQKLPDAVLIALFDTLPTSTANWLYWLFCCCLLFSPFTSRSQLPSDAAAYTALDTLFTQLAQVPSEARVGKAYDQTLLWRNTSILTNITSIHIKQVTCDDVLSGAGRMKGSIFAISRHFIIFFMLLYSNVCIFVAAFGQTALKSQICY